MTVLDDAQLAASYRYCRRLNAQHGKTFYLATALLPKAQRPHVHALYGFARYADDLVDHPAPGSHPAKHLDVLRSAVLDGLAGSQPHHPVVRALVATVCKYDLEPSLITDFLTSMQSDLTVTRYQSFADLTSYMWGSASVIGLQLLPILGVSGDPQLARTAASDLGVAFQLTNFIRDVSEDFDRGRIYLPQDSLAEHGVSESMLGASEVTEPVRSLLIAEIARARTFYRRAEAGIVALSPTARDCVKTAFTLYSDILTEIERLDYQVLSHRARVSLGRRLIVGGAGYLRAVARRARS